MDTTDQRRPNWSERERQLLDLIAAGRNNGEIAEALRISPEAAKRQVSEIITKAGVFSREDAADYWRAKQRPGQRFRRAARRVVGMSRWAKLALAGGAAVLLAALLVPPLLFGDDGGPVATEVWFANIEGVPHGTISTLHIWSPNVAADRAVKFDGLLAITRWSPDGQRLAVVNVRPDGDQAPDAELVLLKRPSWQQEVVTLDANWLGISWSPDGRLLVINSDSFEILSRDGQLEHVIQGVPAQAGHVSSGAASWSPNGDFFVAIQDSQLIAGDRDGRRYLIPRPGGIDDWDWRYGRWLDNSSFIGTAQSLFAAGQDFKMKLYRVSLDNGPVAVTPMATLPDFDSTARTAFGTDAFLPPLANGLGHYRATADGTAQVFTASTSSQATNNLGRDIGVQLRDGTVVRDRLPLTAPEPDSFDIVVLNP